MDANHKKVCDDLRGNGVDVIELFDPIDAIGKLDDFVMFLEIKIPGSKATYTRAQLKFISGTKWPVAIIKNADEGMEAFKKREGLSQMDKDRLAFFLASNPGVDKWHPAAVEAALGTYTGRKRLKG